MRFPNAKDFGARGDGLADDAPALQAAIDAPGRRLHVPAGRYRLGAPLRLRPGLELEAAEGASFLARALPEALATPPGPPCSISVAIRGGLWEGAGFRFSFVRGLRVEGATFRDARRAVLADHLDGFLFRGLALEGRCGGLLFAGCCRNGRAEEIDAPGARPDGPVLSFVADGPDLPRGPIENLAFRGPFPGPVLFSSSGSTIRNIVVGEAGGPGAGGRPGVPFPAGGRYDNIVLRGQGYTSPDRERDGERFPSKVLLEAGDFLVTSPFGPRVHPVTGAPSAMHYGVDGALWDGRMLVETGICAWRPGLVVAAEDGEGPAGTHVAIDHGGGLVSRYFHMERGSLRVSPGERVPERALLGWMGRTGRSTGEHLHFQLERDGVPVDPLPALRER